MIPGACFYKNDRNENNVICYHLRNENDYDDRSHHNKTNPMPRFCLYYHVADYLRELLWGHDWRMK
jgi:hypothetical protein